MAESKSEVVLKFTPDGSGISVSAEDVPASSKKNTPATELLLMPLFFSKLLEPEGNIYRQEGTLFAEKG